MINDYDYIDFLFEDEESGEQFFVELNTAGMTMEDLLLQAQTIANDNFNSVKLIDMVDPVTAEIWGLDTY